LSLEALPFGCHDHQNGQSSVATGVSLVNIKLFPSRTSDCDRAAFQMRRSLDKFARL